MEHAGTANAPNWRKAMHAHLRNLGAGALVVLMGGCGGEDRSTGGTTSESGGPQENFTSKVPSYLALGEKSVWQPVPDDGVELGLGWDSREGRVVPNRCVRLAPVHSPGQTTTMTLDEVSSRSQMMHSLNVSAAASVKTMFASGSATASFAKSTSVSSQSTTLLMNATVTNGTLFAAPPVPAGAARTAFPAAGEGVSQPSGENNSGRLTFEPWASALLKKPEEFRAYCGDGYISGITSGARLLASFEIVSKDASARKSAAASIKGSYGPANMSGSGSSSSSTSTTGTEIHRRYMQVGGAKGPIATDETKLNEKLAVLAEEAFESPRFQDMRITPYAQMAEWRGSDAWRNSDDEYGLIADTYWHLTSLEDDTRQVLQNYADYEPRTGKTREELSAFLDDILTVRRAIYAAFKQSDEAASNPAKGEESLTLFEAPESAGLPANSFKAPSGINLRVLGGQPTLGELAQQLQNALPFGNPALLLINLPLPKTEVSEANSRDKATLQKAVVMYYIGPAAQRACGQDPTSRSCLGNKELEAVAKLVPVR
jgi:hypothetical protein